MYFGPRHAPKNGKIYRPPHPSVTRDGIYERPLTRIQRRPSARTNSHGSSCGFFLCHEREDGVRERERENERERLRKWRAESAKFARKKLKTTYSRSTAKITGFALPSWRDSPPLHRRCRLGGIFSVAPPPDPTLEEWGGKESLSSLSQGLASEFGAVRRKDEYKYGFAHIPTV